LRTISLKTSLKAITLASLLTAMPCSKRIEKVSKDIPFDKIELLHNIKPSVLPNDAIFSQRPQILACQDIFSTNKVKDLSQKYDEPFFTKITDVLSTKWLATFRNKKISSSEDLIKTFEAVDEHSRKIKNKKYYRVYYGKADKIADKNLRRSGQNVLDLLTVGHGHTQRGSISLGDKLLKEGDYISEYQADSLLSVDLGKKDKILSSFVKNSMKKHEKDAILSYMYNVDWRTLTKSDSTRLVQDSFFECFNKGEKGLVQSKFNVISAGGVEQAGLAQRRLIELLIFGNGQVYEEKQSQQTFKSLVKKINDKKGVKGINQVVQTLKNYGIDPIKTSKLKAQMLAVVHPEN